MSRDIQFFEDAYPFQNKEAPLKVSTYEDPFELSVDTHDELITKSMLAQHTLVNSSVDAHTEEDAIPDVFPYNMTTMKIHQT